VAEFISLPGRTEGHVSLLAASWWLLSAPKGTLPPSAWGPLHNTAVCFGVIATNTIILEKKF